MMRRACRQVWLSVGNASATQPSTMDRGCALGLAKVRPGRVHARARFSVQGQARSTLVTAMVLIDGRRPWPAWSGALPATARLRA